MSAARAGQGACPSIGITSHCKKYFFNNSILKNFHRLALLPSAEATRLVPIQCDRIPNGIVDHGSSPFGAHQRFSRLNSLIFQIMVGDPGIDLDIQINAVDYLYLSRH